MQWTDAFAKAFTDGRIAWPGISLSQESFERRLREVGASTEDLAAHGCDLYLANACAEGHPEAVRAFEAAFISKVPLYTSRSGVPPEWASEVEQKVRVKLLVGKSPGIRRYRGQAPLEALVRVTAVRVAIDVAAAAAAIRHRPDQEVLDQLVAREADPEVETAKALYRDRFRAVLEESLERLSTREKTLIRLHYIDGLNIDGIGTIYRVHRATVARWLVAIRGRVLADLRSRLAIELGGTSSELRSLVHLLQDDIQLSARRILGS